MFFGNMKPFHRENDDNALKKGNNLQHGQFNTLIMQDRSILPLISKKRNIPLVFIKGSECSSCRGFR